MSAQLPVYGLASGETADIINNNCIGKTFSPIRENIGPLIDSLNSLKAGNFRCEKSRRLAIENYSWLAIGQKYYDLFQTVK